MVTPYSIDAVWHWLHAIEHPQIPAVSIVDLGIVRDVMGLVDAEGQAWEVVLTPYLGRLAMEATCRRVVEQLQARGLTRVRVRIRLWTTGWIGDHSEVRLFDCGVAAAETVAPAQVIDIAARAGGESWRVPRDMPESEEPFCL
jgi:ring-1,2-phenylacetyl-CoA epoxidase subunit PaaD